MKTWIQKIKAATLLYLDTRVHTNFVPLDLGMQVTVQETGRFDLLERLKTFIGSPHEKEAGLLLLGSSGAGKTWASQQLVYQLWEDNSSTTIPLWLSLKSLHTPWKDLLIKHLNHLKDGQVKHGAPTEECLTDGDIRQFFQEKPNLIIVLDGYDELPKDEREHNYFLENDWGGCSVQLVITSRAEALGTHTPFFADQSHRPFTRYYLQSFNTVQLQKMIRKYCETHPNHVAGWDETHYLNYFTTTYELQEFIDKPLLVTMVLDVLPKVLQEAAQELPSIEGEALLKTPLTRHYLYTMFLRQYFMNGAERLEREGVKYQIEAYYNQGIDAQQTKRLPELLEDFTARLAVDMFNHHVNSVKWSAPQNCTGISSVSTSSHGRENEEWMAPYLDDKTYPYASYLRSGSPLVTVSLGSKEYAFIHQSILEFYTAVYLFNGVLQDCWYMTERNLNKDNLQEAPDVLRNLAKRVHEEPLLKEKLFEIIEQSKYAPEVWRAAANAITILNCAGIRFTRRDFKRIRIGGLQCPTNLQSGWGADLSCGVLGEVDFSEADLRYVKFTQAYLDGANFTGACMDAVNFEEKARIPGNHFGFSMEEPRKLIVGDSLCEIKTYSWPEKTLLNKFSVGGFLSDIKVLAVHPQGQQIAIVKHKFDASRHQVSLWDLTTKRRQHKLIDFTKSDTTCIAYSPDGNYFAAGMNNTIRQWDAHTGQLVYENDQLENEVVCLAYSPDSSRLASGDSYRDSLIRQWNVRTGDLLLEFKISSRAAVDAIAYHPFENRLASCSGTLVQEWDSLTGQLIHEYAGHVYRVTCVAYHPDGSRLVSMGSDKMVREWDLKTGVCLQIHKSKYVGSTNYLAYSPEGLSLVFNDDFNIRECGLASKERLKTNSQHTDSVASVAFSPDGQQVASVGERDGSVRQWDVATGHVVRQHLVAGNVEIRSVAYSPDSRCLVAGSRERWPIAERVDTIWRWDIASGELLSEYQNHGSIITYHPDGAFIATARNRYKNDDVYQLEASTGAVLQQLKGSSDYIQCIAYSPNGERLVAGSVGKDNTLHEWNVTSGESLSVRNTSAQVKCVAYSADNQRLFAGSFEVAYEWDVTTQAIVRRFKCPEDYWIQSAAYSQNHRYLVFGVGTIYGIDGFVQVANAQNNSKDTYQLCLDGAGSIYGVAWSPDSTKLVTGGGDHAVRLWQVVEQPFGQVKLVLLWQTHAHLSSRDLQLYRVTGLSEDNYQLLKQCSKGSLQGERARNVDGNLIESKTILAERNSQIYIPDGQLIINNDLDSTTNRYLITPTRWLVSMMRKVMPPSSSASTVEGMSGNHVCLLISGMTPEKLTFFREIHFYRDTEKSSQQLLYYVSGKGLISVRHAFPYDLIRQLANKQYLAKSWCITPEKAHRLLANVERDRGLDLNYGNIGQTLFSGGYSCVTFCEKQLKEIGIVPEKDKPWYHLGIELPSHYLPNEVPHKTQAPKKCLVM